MRYGGLGWLLWLWLALAPAQADSMRCNNRLITDGDPVALLLLYCGEPLVREVAWRHYRNHYGRWYQEPDGERWTYHFGRYQFMQIVTIRRGKIVSIENGPRG
ncbi:hypothetical protein UN63_06860 [Oceanisphaera arctica]|uniref:DUF2845 domain-containing protein n=2 Tax=Oceanisphaera arctica TaxID=641510 RepID=A0A2P5TNB3_9GAMM|nr:DUF2845 domain-containing protein [Oceanisphaera arctica]PPL17039.1 hypothetical protein UN63_06860 [Oceanisphaera arctica]GHA07204.1 hypothetical protein GCM10007082_05050 [Oceanisphaera arctica]